MLGKALLQNPFSRIQVNVSMHNLLEGSKSTISKQDIKNKAL